MIRCAFTAVRGHTSEGAVEHAGLENMVAIVRLLASRTKAPVALHLDHGKSVE